jgi:hypothetical protein
MDLPEGNHHGCTDVLFTAMNTTGSVDLCLTVLSAAMYVPHV